jgi:colanic acid/amylovoran biosynthesis glycosyltransferase
MQAGGLIQDLRMSIVYLSNRFPEIVEPYVYAEIDELRKRACAVLPCSFRRPEPVPRSLAGFVAESLYAFPLRWTQALGASWLCLRQFSRIADLIWRAVRGPEPVSRRLRTLAHTWLGVYLAVLLRHRAITHIHVHHGYFSAWAGMVAGRLLGAGFSMTLHGSDLLVRADYLDAKLKNCRFCVTISDFNRKHIIEHYPNVDAGKTLVHHIGVDLEAWHPPASYPPNDRFSILSIGRLHPVKNHGFLLLACRELKSKGVKFRCVIVGEGTERGKLESLVREMDIESEVLLQGTVAREELPQFYADANVVVLTSHSEGVPVTLMEAMAMGRVVLAPRITGIPELVRDGQTGFLYQPNSMQDFLTKLDFIRVSNVRLDRVIHAARFHIATRFNNRLNLVAFAKDFLERTVGTVHESCFGVGTKTYEDPLLQQVQLRVQRNRSLSV